jgi:hypothetical protein
MSCEPILDDLFECSFCETQFARGVADPGPSGEPRCPQCGLTMAHPIAPEEAGEFVVTQATKFR